MQNALRATFIAIAAGLVAWSLPYPAAAAEAKDSSRTVRPTDAAKVEKPADTSPKAQADDLPPISLLDALRKGEVAVRTEGRDDGRVNVSVTNKTRKKLRVVLPPGMIAQTATGQMGGMMGGMGGGGMGGMGGMGGGMRGGMGGGMGGGMRGGGMMGGRTMPPMMGMMSSAA